MFLHNDEATIEDRLSRDRIARALAEAVLRASPPLVVGIYGSWGVGKTSLMKLMESALIGRSGVETVWFDPWFHQFDTNPEIAMLHAMADGVHDVEEAKKLLAVIGATLGATALRALTGLKLSEIRELGDQYEQEMFQVREKQAKLQEKFGKLIDLITDSGEKRLVIFVDDLDRCTPTTILKILDALKLYLSHAGCVYVVGIDRSVVEKSIKLGLPGMEGYESQYLDKLVQLPFNVPSLGKGELRAYVSSMLPETLSMVAQLFSEGLDGNPRTIKRFIVTVQVPLAKQLARRLTLRHA
jgi:predicted KAP-like P-loop ATPase